MHCHAALGQRVVEISECTATLLVGSEQSKYCNAPPHCLGAVSTGTPVMHRHVAFGHWTRNSCSATPHCLDARGRGNLVRPCHTSCGQWAAELLQCNDIPPGGSGQSGCRIAVRHYLGALGSGIVVMHNHTAGGQAGSENGAMHRHASWGQRVVELLHCTATLPRGTRQWNYFNAPEDRLCAACDENATMHCHTA